MPYMKIMPYMWKYIFILISLIIYNHAAKSRKKYISILNFRMKFLKKMFDFVIILRTIPLSKLTLPWAHFLGTARLFNPGFTVYNIFYTVTT